MDDSIKVKAALLDLLIELDRICEENELSYFITGGTMLGAIRHKGFIPWDDDIDVAMLREDYEKFTKVCNQELNKDYMFISWENDDDYPNLFAKLKIKNTEYVEKISQNGGQNKGIFIDVFPIDNAPNSVLKSKIQGIRIAYHRRLLAIKCKVDFSGNNSIIKKIGNYILKIIANIYSKKWLYKKCDKLCKAFNSKKTDYVVNCFGAYPYIRERVPREFLEKTVKTDFEDYKFNVPIMFDKYLTQIYGNYMELPPVEKRGSRHQIVKIDFGNYEIKAKLRG